MSLTHLFPGKRAFATCLLLAAPIWLMAQQPELPPEPPEVPELPVAEPESGAEPVDLIAPDEAAKATDMVEQIIFRDETTDQVLDLLERLTGRAIIRPQALPAATFTFNSQKAMTREEAILALQSMLSINGIGVTPMGDLFLKVVPLTRLRAEAPEFVTGSTLSLPSSGRIVSRMIQLEFLSLDEIQTQLNLMITQGSGSIIAFPKANAMLITDTVSNLQAIEQLLANMDRPFAPRTTTRFFPLKHAQATELVSQIQQLAGAEGVPELSGRTVITADERSNQIILVADQRQMGHFQELIEKLDVQAELNTRNEVIFLKHADALDVHSILSQLAGGGATPRAGGSGTGTRSGGPSGSRLGGSSGSRLGGASGSSRLGGGGAYQRQPQQQGRRQAPQVPQIPGVRAQQAEDAPAPSDSPAPAEGGLSVEGAEGVLNELAGSTDTSDFSETLSIIADERSNAIIVSGTRQDIQLITDLIEKIDIILAQVRIEVFIAEVTLSDTTGRGIEAFGFTYQEGSDRFDFNLEGPGYAISRDNLEWTALFDAADTNSAIDVLSVPTIVTTHNREATLFVGQQRPVITGTIADGSFSSSIRSQIQQLRIGIELAVKPLIGSDGTIQLEIAQTVEDVIDTVRIDQNDQPVVGTRMAESFVSVANGETVIMGGLQSSSQSDRYGRLGLLGQIPVLGNLFTYKRAEHVRTELLVFIRPTVLLSTDDAHQDAQRQIDRQSRSEHIRHQMEPSVYPDPDKADDEYDWRSRLRRGTGAGSRL